MDDSIDPARIETSVDIRRPFDGSVDVLRQFDAVVEYSTETGYDQIGTVRGWIGWQIEGEDLHDAAGRVQSVTDAKGSTSYGYDGTDSGGAGERRGLVTSMTVTRGGTAGSLTYGAQYDADGNLSRQTLPGRITRVASFDEGGQLVGLQYLGQVTPVTAIEDPVTHEISYVPGTPIEDQPWLAWTLTNDGAGRVRFEESGQGAAYDNGDGVVSIDDVTEWAAGQATSYQREYQYDYAGRLTFAQDAAAASVTGGPTVSCTTRTYVFDKNGRRTSRTTTNRSEADCAATGTTVTTTAGGYDTADRPTTGAGGVGSYVYDPFGRQTTIPAADAPNPAGGAVTLAYFDDDLPQAVTQGGTSTTFTLDAAGRRSVQTTTDATGTTTTTRRYTDDTDSPAWIEQAGPAGTSTTQYTPGIGGDLSAAIAADGTVSLSLPDAHGDVVTTVDIPAAQADTTPAAGIDGWADYTEYGAAATSSSPAAVGAVAGVAGYGWLGAKERSATDATAGFTLMGVRLYNPATGQFTSLDPVPGGNTTLYVYPQDPINQFDLNGMWWSWLKTAAKAVGSAAKTAGKWAWNHKVDIALTAVSFVPVVGVAAWAVRGTEVAARIGAWAFRAKGIGATSRLFGDVRSGAKVSGLFNRGSRIQVGWSGMRVYKADGSKSARTVFRISFKKSQHHVDLAYGPYRGGK
ncbi:MAG: hypothetical protein BGO26_02210 [Actinobacteria bacterium 69-20]|nr:hypothetical protein [Actinomycetota bacterium]OJV31285.1 MAG: hypothetical protein BGO26_02210 [Actinobacteria bacterium 69-20]